MKINQILTEYGDTAKGQKMLTKVQKRAVDRMIKADDKRDAKAAKKNQDTANRAWDRMTDKDLEEQGVAEAAKWRDPKYKDRLYTQEPGDSDEYDDIGYGYDFPERPDNDPGQKRRIGGVGSEFDHNDPLKKGQGIGRMGIKHSLNTAGKRKGLPSRDQITSLKGSIRDAHGKHHKPNLPEQGVAEGSLNEFAPNDGGDGDGPDEYEILHRLAAMWWLGTEQQMIKAQRTLASMGWEIGEDEGYDDGGVFVVRANDEHGKSYISWPHEDLQLNEQGVAEGEVTRTPTGLTHRATDRYGAGDDDHQYKGGRSGFADPGKYARDLETVNKQLVKDLDASMGITWKNRGTKGVEVDEGGDKVGNMDADKFDAAMDRLKKLAGAGPLKTVYDPKKRVYKNVPTAVQPKK